MAAPEAAAAATYRQRLATARARALELARADMRLAAIKLILVFVTLAVAWLAFISQAVSAWWLLLPGGLLVAAFAAHDHVLRARAEADRIAAFYERGLARLEHRWMGRGTNGERFRDPSHVYSDDLDLFGAGGMFELLCTARTSMGEECLAAWLLSPAAPGEVQRRQQQVETLRPALDLRQQIATLGDELKRRLDPARLRAWAVAPPCGPQGAARVLYAGLSALSVLTLTYAFGRGFWAPFIVLVLIQAVIIYGRRAHWSPVLTGGGANREGLNQFAGVLAHAPEADSAAVAALRRLGRLTDWIDASDTLLGRILDITVLYSLNLAGAAEAWRRRWGGRVGEWLDAVGEFEALLALASHAYEHPEDPFPELVASPAPVYRGEQLGHPLLPEAECVRNSIALDEASRLWIVSGSNMSGKSTWLRTVGLNAVLAQMGAPVRARSLQLTPLAVGTRLRTQDSLQQGRSGFYAELLRLRQVFDLTRGPLPVLYLFDELMEGTNSHDRVRGAAGLLGALLRRPALGLITTHDLALAALAGELGPSVRNIHFEDQISGNDVSFDHRLRDGVVTKSNALALMRIVGLEV